MTAIDFDGRQLVIGFSGWEAFMTRRSSHSVPIEAIHSVELLDDWTSEILGVRVGLVVSGYRKLGTFTHPDGTRRLVSMTRGKPLLRVRLRDRSLGGGFDELLVSASEAAELAEALRTATPA